MKVAVVKETAPGERRVALVPSVVSPLVKSGVTVQIEAGAGAASGYPDKEYADKGTIRAELGTNIERNACHGSVAPETARQEIAFFFSGAELAATTRE